MIIDELFEAPQLCPECGGISFSDLILAEKKDACYHKVKASAKVWPSAYASGRLVQCRKKGAANYGNKSEGMAEGSKESYMIIRTDAEGKKDVFAGNFDTYERAQKELDGLLAHPLHTKYKQKFEIKRKGQEGVAEGSEKDMSKEVKAMATGKCPHCHGPVEKKEHPTLTQYHCAKCGIRASIDKQGVAEGLNQGIPSVLYHATYKPRLKSIKLKGLGAGGKRNWEDSKSGAIYLALDPNVAESYAESSDMVPDEWLDQIVILKISTAGLDSSKFSIDSNVQDNAGDTVEYHGVIPVSNISLYEQGVAEAEQQPGADYRDPKEVDYDGEYDAMVARVKRLAGLGPLKTVYDPTKRQYRNMPTAQQPKR